MTKTNAIVDYAYPCMMAEKALKEVHNAMLNSKYDDALANTLIALSELRLMQTSIKIMQEQNRG